MNNPNKITTNRLEELSKRVEQLEAEQHTLTEALKLLLPMALAIPACTSDSAAAIKELSQALKNAEHVAPRSETFWYLASAMALAMSSRAVTQHPDDQEVVEIFQGLRAGKMQ